MDSVLAIFGVTLEAKQEKDESNVVEPIACPAKLQLERIPWRVPGIELREEASSQHRFLMAERFERVLAMVPPHPAWPYSSEWQPVTYILQQITLIH